MLTREQAAFETATKLRAGTATVGEIYTFISGLYFRGKMAYAAAFGAPPPGLAHALVIVPGHGLLPADTPVTLADLRAISEVPVDEDHAAYRDALCQSAAQANTHAGPDPNWVLLGSIATAKYTAPLLDIFGDRLLFPSDFVGRGDMSRGGLMLRCATSGDELAYTPVAGAVRHGTRPPKLPRLRPNRPDSA